jgi:cell division protein ZapA
MNKEPGAVKVNILDKEYLVACPAEEKQALLASARHLSEKMTEIRASGKVVGMDRIAVMAGLNIAHEALESGASAETSAHVAGRISKLNTDIEETLAKYRQTELSRQ